ncbi:GNAT family N-acetyltransferase [Roseimaritima multifibrata]|uniref:GNAT family N-acetyltransferase n=1 Tax=Roseimaritima multifibrata TaxID=1930274 RepID=UPI0011AAE8F5|nr:GNAT family N-acetyltransferase [Roseimaritima multifibrata]
MIKVRPLRPDDRRDEFTSGDIDLDRFFQKFAGQNQFRLHIGTTYVAVNAECIVGFVTVSATSIVITDLPKGLRNRLPKYPLPALRLARLAVARNEQGRGIGKLLLRATFDLAREMAKRTGCIGVVVDAKPDAIQFYKRYGFESLEVISGKLGDRPAPQPMFLPLGSIPKR